MKTILKLVLILIAGILVYNYFLGTADEKAQSARIFNEVKELGASVKDLLVDEHQKFRNGKYDGLFDRLENIYTDLEKQWKDEGPELNNSLDSLQDRRRELEDKYSGELDSTRQDQLKTEFDQLLEDTKKLIEKNSGSI